MGWLIAAMVAAAPLAGAKLQQETEEKARAEVTDLLRALCPEQCVLLSVRAQMDEEETGGQLTPGFDAPGARTVPVVRGVTTSVLVDQRLPMQFRTRLKTVIAQRLKGVGVPPEIALEQVAFPVKNPPYLESHEPLPATQPPAAAPQEPEKPKLETATPVGPRLRDRLIEEAPLLAIMVLLGAVVLALGCLIYMAARRSQDPYLTEPLPPEQLPAPAPVPAPAAIALEPMPATRLRKLEKQLVDDRVLRNTVVREALGRGEHALVARWVRELGDFLLEDLRGDGTLAQALAGVATELVKLPTDPAARISALQDLEGRALAARLARAGDASAFSFLEGVREEAFVSALRAISPGAQEVALRLAPAHLRSAALRELPAAQRQEIALSWVRKPEISAQYALAAADELREHIAGLHAGAAEVDRALMDLLDSLPRQNQDVLIEQLRSEGDPRAVAGLLTESALQHAPPDLLAASMLGVAPAKLVAYLSGADEAVRAHVLSACPTQLRREVEEELSLSAGTSRDDFLGARRELLAQVRQETLKRGLKPSDVRTWRPRVVKAP